MLAEDEPIRVFHNAAKETFDLYDMVVVGIVNESDRDGVFNPDTLARIHALTKRAQNMSWPSPNDPDEREGVVGVDVIAPSNVDDIRQAGLGDVSFSWLMQKPPETREGALEIRERALRIPMLRDTMVSSDGQALALYLPLTSKDVSWNVRRAIQEFTEDWPEEDQVHITGLPVAEDTFGVEMFYQMAISAPLAMLVIFLLMWAFFRNLVLVISPMIVAMVSALSTMALLVISGNTIHIMSSMIPIFIMPTAVLDSVHILSECFDSYRRHGGDRKKTMQAVMRQLFRPMLFTSLTTTAGFASLALTPIPPVQVFGVFVAIGVMLAWFWSILFIPAYFMLIPERRLANFGHMASEPGTADGAGSLLGRALKRVGKWSIARRKAVGALAAALILIAVWGISLIQINDNPTKWFTKSHPIRVADRVLNEHFAGTYTSFLELESTQVESVEHLRERITDKLMEGAEEAENSDDPAMASAFNEAADIAREQTGEDFTDWVSRFQDNVNEKADSAENSFAWDQVWMTVDRARAESETFKQPEVLKWVIELQEDLLENPRVGKVNALPDIVRVVHRELLGGEDEAFRIPDRPDTVAETLMTYQNSHRPQDLWRFVTPDYRKTNLWIQMNTGDNQDMEHVVADLNAFMEEHPPPDAIEANWFGLTYINVIWQEKMVNGMLLAFLGSFAVVLLMMTLLFRSFLWGLLAMIPLSVTVALIYGIIGLIGKDYDMPVAVLSALSLGLAVDFAIHFLIRTRQYHTETGDWFSAAEKVFGEPALAISRNVIILGAGFLPLLAAPLIPYQTVGVFIAAIIFSGGVITLILLPALVTWLRKPLFNRLTTKSDS
ncbi:MAG: efflux RND transporter permease subunit [Opitutales bacterium]